MDGQAVMSDATGIEPRRLWLRSAVLWGALALLTLGLYHQTTLAMVSTWWVSASYQHCLLIPLVVAFLVWERRALFGLAVPAPSLLGVVGVIAAGFLWVLGGLVGAMILQQLALVLTLQALVLAIFGWTVVRALIFPLFFMLFLVPAGDGLVQPLQNITADMTVWLLQVVGIPTFREGVFISTPTGHFHVAEACSGVRYLVAMVPLGLLFANMSFTSLTRRTAVMVLAVVVPVLANGVRAFGIIYIAYLSDNKYAIGVDHLIYGWIFFAFVTLLLIGIGMLFSDKPLDAPVVDYGWIRARPMDGADRRGLPMAAASAAAVLFWAVLALRLDAVPDSPVLPAMTAPAVAGDWNYLGTTGAADWKPEFAGAADSLTARYRRAADGAEVILYYAYYPYQREGAELVQFGNTLMPHDWDWNGERRLTRMGQPVTESQVADRGRSRLVWSWYWVDGAVSADPMSIKFNLLRARLFGGNDAGAVVAFSTDVGHRAEDAPQVLADFMQKMQSNLPGFPEPARQSTE